MSLFSSIQLAKNALSAAQIGLQIAGNNIANANTPGYIRQELALTPAPTQRQGRLVLGLGVEIKAVTQKIDQFLEERFRSATSDLANSEAQESAYLQLESLIGELSDTDLSTSLNNLFGAIHDILNQPESTSVRNMAVLQGQTLARDISRLSQRVREVRDDVNTRILDSAANVNRLLAKIASLNVQISSTEGGDTSESDAVGLRDERGLALGELASIIGIRTDEQPNGTVTVFAGGQYLVFEGAYRELTTVVSTDRGMAVAELRVASTDSPISTSSGELAGLYSARDEILGGFLDRLDDFARTLIFEFNKTYSSGQGLKGNAALTSEFTVNDTAVALDQAGLEFTPVNGSFQVQVRNKQTGLTNTTDVLVPLSGLSDDMTLQGLAAALDAIDGISAETTPSRGLTIRADSPNLEFAFANDSTGVLAALGLATFFTGSTAQNMDVSSVVRDDPAKFAASRTGIGEDTDTAVELANFLDKELETQDGATLAFLYDRMTGETTQGAAVSRAVADGLRVFEQTLEGQHMAISGVSLDEEAVRMITYQRMFQASARFIATVSEMLDVLVNL